MNDKQFGIKYDWQPFACNGTPKSPDLMYATSILSLHSAFHKRPIEAKLEFARSINTLQEMRNAEIS